MSKAPRPTLDSLSSRFARKDPLPVAPGGDSAPVAAGADVEAPGAEGAPARKRADDRVQILTRIDPATRKRLKVIAAQQERTIQQICEEAIRDFVARHSK